jgi:hypothetical protein
MTGSLTVECKIHFKKGCKGQRQLKEGHAPAPKPVKKGRVPRITKLLALALHFEKMIKKGQVRDFADIANLGYVSRARLTQIMNLLLLAPDIQTEILFLPRTIRGTDAVLERQVRPIAAQLDWSKQRQIWQELPVCHQ